MQPSITMFAIQGGFPRGVDYAEDCPRGLLQVGIIIDDLVVMEQIVRAPPSDQGHHEGPRRIEKAKKAYAAVPLQDNPKKAFLEQTMTRFWGVEIDGSKGIYL